MLFPSSQLGQKRFRHLKQRKSKAETLIEHPGAAHISSDFAWLSEIFFEMLSQKFSSIFFALIFPELVLENDV